NLFMARTNHAIDSDNVISNDWFTHKKFVKDKGGQTVSNTLERFQLINKLLSKKPQSTKQEDIRNFLSEDPILRKEKNSITLQTMIATCDSDYPVLCVARSNEPDREYIKIAIK